MKTYRFGKFEITLSAKFTNEYIDKFGNGEMGKFIVYVEYKGKRLQFAFYESVYDTRMGKPELIGNDLVDAFDCFVSDVMFVLSNDWNKSEIEKEIGEISNETFASLKISAKSFLRLFEYGDAFELKEMINGYIEEN